MIKLENRQAKLKQDYRRRSQGQLRKNQLGIHI
jgi:hypothetical protein